MTRWRLMAEFLEEYRWEPLALVLILGAGAVISW
jgi:hypothetical protein